MKSIEADLCVIGAGSAGLTVAAGAAQMGARTILVERAKMGGDCLNYGCVPSKSLLAAAHMAASARDRATAFGIFLRSPLVDAAAVHNHVQSVIAAIAPHDSIDRFESLGVTVIRADARFGGPAEIIAGETAIRARRFVVATGSSPARPDIPGLGAIPYLTNETVFSLTCLPEHLVIIGGGPVGVELAQAYAQLGARVTVLQRRSILPRDDPDLVAVVRSRLLDNGIELHEGVTVHRVDGDASKPIGDPAGRVTIVFSTPAGARATVGSHLLIAVGRAPNLGSLDLQSAGISFDARGIKVDHRLRTSNPKIFAIGDVVGGLKFTHIANYHATVVLKNALFRLPARVDYRVVPWVTYTDPELAQVGLTEEAAKSEGRRYRLLTCTYRDNDRAQTERRTCGMIKVLTTRSGHILGVGIVGAAAGELIHTWVLAMSQRLKVGTVASMIVPYPTFGEINKRAAGAFYASALFGRRVRWFVRLLARLG